MLFCQNLFLNVEIKHSCSGETSVCKCKFWRRDWVETRLREVTVRNKVNKGISHLYSSSDCQLYSSLALQQKKTTELHTYRWSTVKTKRKAMSSNRAQSHTSASNMRQEQKGVVVSLLFTSREKYNKMQYLWQESATYRISCSWKIMSCLRGWRNL